MKGHEATLPGDCELLPQSVHGSSGPTTTAAVKSNPERDVFTTVTTVCVAYSRLPNALALDQLCTSISIISSYLKYSTTATKPSSLHCLPVVHLQYGFIAHHYTSVVLGVATTQ